ncbi:Conidiation protein 6-domain-containing protein [Chaetomium strumarium]|uniref:Conidiation protein 6-domain-containing protein n=1 Tax=Chaetomium strumarium TaxID=1170767 RepID=A0AAJ0LYV1_9PEZI|nr:Conidiation protein 6-domain-containing protein [Chaetomium strumarium]
MADMYEGDIPKEVPASEDYAPEQENVMRGHKATIANPQTSEKAKEHSRKVLESMDEPYDPAQAHHGSQEEEQNKDPGNVARGLKASISNPGVSEEAKEKAKEKLSKLGQ